MKALIISLFLFITVSVSAQNVTVVVEEANLRSAPSKQSRIIATMSLGQVIKLIKKTGEWRKVRTKNGIGWLHRSTVLPGRRRVFYGTIEPPVVTPQADLMMQSKIEENISKLGVSEIKVIVSSGEAILTGTVAKDRLAEVMRAVMEADVKRINNKLIVK